MAKFIARVWNLKCNCGAEVSLTIKAWRGDDYVALLKAEAERIGWNARLEDGDPSGCGCDICPKCDPDKGK